MLTTTFELFVYGSLRSARLRRQLLGREIPTVPARLVGFAKVKISGSPYPGLVYSPSSQTEGELLLQLTHSELLCLDCYEGEEYQRIEVLVEAQGKTRYAFVYRWRDLRVKLDKAG